MAKLREGEKQQVVGKNGNRKYGREGGEAGKGKKEVELRERKKRNGDTGREIKNKMEKGRELSAEGQGREVKCTEK